MKTTIAFFVACAVSFSLSTRSHASEDNEISVLCQAQPEATAAELYTACNDAIRERICPQGFELLNHIKNVVSPPFFLAATITCKQAPAGVRM